MCRSRTGRRLRYTLTCLLTTSSAGLAVTLMVATSSTGEMPVAFTVTVSETRFDVLPARSPSSSFLVYEHTTLPPIGIGMSIRHDDPMSSGTSVTTTPLRAAPPVFRTVIRYLTVSPVENSRYSSLPVLGFGTGVRAYVARALVVDLFGDAHPGLGIDHVVDDRRLGFGMQGDATAQQAAEDGRDQTEPVVEADAVGGPVPALDQPDRRRAEDARDRRRQAAPGVLQVAGLGLDVPRHVLGIGAGGRRVAQRVGVAP